jgi:hypothetical protein
MFISFAPPKEMNQRKGGRKRQPLPVCPPATQDLLAPPNRERFTPFPVCPRSPTRNNLFLMLDNIIFKNLNLFVKVLIASEKKGDASPSQKPQVIQPEQNSFEKPGK